MTNNADLNQQRSFWIAELNAYESQSAILKTWQPVKYLDKGTFSRIFLAIHRETGSFAALKFVPNPLELEDCAAAGTPENTFHRTRFAASKREAEIMNRFRGEKHIAQYLTEPEYLQRVFTNAEGHTVIQYAVLICMPLYLNHKEWIPLITDSRTGRLRLGMEIAQALMCFEEKGVFHRDIKPGNILMDDSHHFFLGDVGEAKLESEFTTTGFHGTRPYMAPEVYRQEQERSKMRSDHRSDIYSLGIILYRLYNRQQFPFLTESGTLTEEATFSYRRYEKKHQLDNAYVTDSERARLLRYDGETLPAPKDADTQLTQIILRACAYNKEDRYQKAADLYDALRYYSEGTPLPVHLRSKKHGKLSAKSSSNQFSQQSKTVMIAIGASAMTLVIAGTGVMFSGRFNRNIVPASFPSAHTLPATSAMQFSLTTSTVMITATPTAAPTASPAITPTASPTATPTTSPTITPTATPTAAPTASPTAAPTASPTAAPTTSPTYQSLSSSDFDYIITMGQVTIKKYLGSAAHIIIPSKIKGFPVTSISNFAFSQCNHLTSISIPSSIMSIGEYAFSSCNNLTDVSIADGVTSIGTGAFSYCSNLIEISIPDSLAFIGDQAFSRCTKLAGISIPTSITSIGTKTFQHCESLLSISIPENVTSIGDGVFSGCDNLATISIPDSVTSIGNNAFQGCGKLTSLTIPKSVTSIGDGIFSGCDNLATISIPDGVISIGNDAFWGCSKLTSITIPDSIISIGENAFQACRSLSHLFIPSNVTSIGRNAFSNCSILTIAAPANSYAKTYADENSIPFVTVGFSVTPPEHFIYSSWFGRVTIKGYTGPSDTVVIPAEIDGKPVTSIRRFAFKNCSNLTSITIPEGVTSIGKSAFYSCAKLTSITIPDSVTSIGEYAFKGCNLTDISIPEGITKISNSTFANCNELTSIEIPHSVTQIGEKAFEHCSVLTNITIPNSVTKIGDNAFYYCPNLTLFTPSGSYANTYAKENSIPLLTYDIISKQATIKKYTGSATRIVIPEQIEGKPVTAIHSNAFIRSDLVNIVLPDSLTEIGNSAFHGCTKLYSITIPDNVTEIDNSAFSNCTSLTSLIIPDSVTSIGDKAFGNCTQLAKITLPNNLTAISAYSFRGCKNLTNITLPSHVTTINRYAFWNCSSLTNIMIPNGMTTIGEKAFLNCEKLTSITIPDSVTSIGEDAFSRCPNLTIHAKAGSYAQTYAKNNNILFKPVTNTTNTSGIIMKSGSTGDDVMSVKLRLKELGYYSENAEFSAEFNDIMTERIRQFQQDNNLSVTGFVDTETYQKLFERPM